MSKFHAKSQFLYTNVDNKIMSNAVVLKLAEIACWHWVLSQIESNSVTVHLQGSKKVPSNRPGQVDFCAGHSLG